MDSQSPIYDALEESRVREYRKPRLSEAQIREKNFRERKRIEGLINSRSLRGQKPSQIERTHEIRIVLLGRSDEDISATANMLLGMQDQDKGHSSDSFNNHTLERTTKYKDRDLRIISTSQAHNGEADIRQEMARILFNFPEGVHAFLLVIDASQGVTEEDINILNDLKDICGEDVLQHCGIVLTQADETLHQSSLWTYLDEKIQSIHTESFVRCELENRVLAVNNCPITMYETRLTRSSLVDFVDFISENNECSAFTNGLFEMTRDSLVEEHMKLALMLQKEMLRMEDDIKENMREISKLMQQAVYDCSEIGKNPRASEVHNRVRSYVDKENPCAQSILELEVLGCFEKMIDQFVETAINGLSVPQVLMNIKEMDFCGKLQELFQERDSLVKQCVWRHRFAKIHKNQNEDSAYLNGDDQDYDAFTNQVLMKMTPDVREFWGDSTIRDCVLNYDESYNYAFKKIWASLKTTTIR